MSDQTFDCPLCQTLGNSAFGSDRNRQYRRCSNCQLVFVPTRYRLGIDAERAEYDRHQNSPNDPGYRRFLSRLVDPLLERLPTGSTGLDFGCGPGPTLSLMFEESGHSMALYDPYYRPDPSVFERMYDFITLSEVIEHLFEPGAEFQRLRQCLRPGGWLGIMTKRVIDRARFDQWHYKNDPTHVCFFSRETFEWLASFHDLELELPGHDVALMRLRGPVSVSPSDESK